MKAAGTRVTAETKDTAGTAVGVTVRGVMATSQFTVTIAWRGKSGGAHSPWEHIKDLS